MAFKSTLVFLFACQHICCVMAAECTTAIIASIFGTIGVLLVVAAIVALAWYCCKRGQAASFASTSSADSVSDPDFSFGGKAKGGDIGLDGSGTPVTFSHHYSEKAPSVAYNASGVVNPAFGGSREFLIDMPPDNKGEVKIDMEGNSSMKPPAYNRDVKIDMNGESDIETPSGTGNVKLDMEWDPRKNVGLPDGNHVETNLPAVSGPVVGLPDDKPSGSCLPGVDAKVIINDPSKPKLDVGEVGSLKSEDVFLERPGRGGFGLLIARDKTLQPPALFVREVTPGGIAAKTGRIDKGDKIVGINGASIEGMPHDKAMELLRDDERPMLHLKLLKKALYSEKDRSFELPGGSMEETCNVEIEPVLQAGVPSVDVEGMRDDTPDFGSMDISARKPRVNMSEPRVDMPGGTLKTPISDPNAFSDVDLSGPSTGLDLPSTKKKSGSCFSCASTGDKDEPYSKGRANAGLDLDRPDMKTDRNVKVSGAPPEVSVPSANTGGTLSGPSVNGDDFDFDSSCPDVDTSKRPKAHLDSNASSTKTPQGNLATQISQPEVDLSTGKRQAPQGKFDVLPTGKDLPPKKKKGGNCFSCIGDTNKDQPYRKRRENVDLDIDGPGGSMEMSTGGKFDLSGSGPNIQEAEGRIPQKELGLRASAPDLDVDKEQNVDISTPDVSPPSSSVEMKTGKFDLDGSGPTSQGAEGRLPQKEFGLHASVPDVDLDVDKERNIDISGPDASLPSSSATAKISGPSFGGDDEPFEPNLDFKASKPKVEIGANGQDFTAPDLRPEVDVSSDKTKDTSVKLGAPSLQMDLPSSKKKRGNCLNCTGTGGKEEPYRKASGVGYAFDEREAGGSIEMKKIVGPDFDVHGRDGGVSGPDSVVLGSGPDFGVQGSQAAVSRPDFDIGGPNEGVSGPDLGVREPNANVSGLDVSAPKTSISGPTSSISGPDLDVRGTNVGISGGKPKMESDTNIPSVNAPEGKIDTKVSGPNVDVSTGNIKDPEVTVDRPSAGLHLPSKRAKGGNCLSCTASPDKDEPYRKSKGNADFAFNGPDVYAEGPDADIEGLKKKSENAFNVSADAPGTDNLNLEEDAGIPFTNASFPSTSGGGEFDVSGSGPDLGIRTKQTGVEYDANGPKLKKTKGKLQTEISSPDVDVSTGNVQGPSSDGRLPSRKKARGNCLSCAGDADKDEPYGKSSGSTKFKLEKPDINGSLKIEEGGKFDLDESSVNINDPDFEGTSPDIDLPSDKAKVGFKSSEFDIPSIEGNGEVQITRPELSHEKPKISGPSFDPGDKEFSIWGPDLDIDTALGEGKWDVSKPAIAGYKGKIDLDANRPDLDFAAAEPQFGVKGLHIDSPESDNHTGDLRFCGSLPDLDVSGKKPEIGLDKNTNGPERKLDLDFKRPGLDVSETKPRFGVKGFDTDTPDRDISDGDLGFTGNIPDLGLSGKKPEIELGMDGPDNNVKESKGKFDLDVNRPGLDDSGTKPQFGIKGLDMNTPEPVMPAGNLHFGNSKPDVSWGVKTSTPKAPEPHPELDVETKPVDGSISVANDYNFELQSTPDRFPSLDYEKPRSLQRYDEIRPDMELRLLSPKTTEHPDNRFDFSLDSSLDMEQSGEQLKPGEMTLVKVEENVTVCSASIEEDDSPTPRNRTLTLDREIKQQIEVVFPKEESSKEKRKSSSSSSSSSPSDADADGEKTSKRKKKSRLLKAFRKSSTSSASSKEDGSTVKKKRTKRRSSSSSSSDDENKRKKDKKKGSSNDVALPTARTEQKKTAASSSSSSSDHAPDVEIVSSIKRPKPDVSLDAVTTDTLSLPIKIEKLKERKSSTSSSSSDEDTGKENTIQKKEPRERKSSTSSTSSTDKDDSRDIKVSKLSNDADGPVVNMPTVVFHTIKPTGPGLSIALEKPEDRAEPKQRKTSTSSSSDSKEPTNKMTSDDSKPSMLYQVEYFTNQQTYILEPHEDLDKPVLSVADVQEEAPKVEFHSVDPRDPEVSFIKPSERKRSTSSSSSSNEEPTDKKKEDPVRKCSTSSSSSDDSGRVSPKLDTTLYRYETVHHILTPDYPSVDETNPQIVPEHPVVVVSRSFKNPVSENISTTAEDQDKPQNAETQFSEPPVDMIHHLEYPYNIPTVKADSDKHGKEEDIVPVVKLKSDFLVELEPDEKPPEDEDSTEHSKTASKEDRDSPTLNIQTHTFETVYRVNMPENPAVDGDSLQIREHSPIVVSRSRIQNPVSENISTATEDQDEPQNAETQFSEPPVDITHHLEYPYNIPTVKADSDKHAKEEDIVPVVKLKSDFLVDLEPDEKPPEDEASTEHSKTAGKEDRDSPTLNIQTHTFETVYHVNMPENLAVDGDSLEIREHSPIVVSRSIKRISPEEVDQEEQPPLFTTNTDVQFSEPSSDFLLEYPEGDNVFITGEHDLKMTDEKWIVSHSLQKEEPDIPALVASLDRPEEKTQPRSDPSRDEGDKATSPHEKSAKDTRRRSSNSRLWELMQGYLIEKPITDDDETKAEPSEVEEFKEEIAKPEPKEEETVYRISLKPAKFETLNAPVQVVDKEPAKEVITSGPKVDTVSKVVPSVSQIDPVAFQVYLGGKKPEVKKYDAELRKQPSLPVDEDDSEDDPWMRHYSRGLQRGQRQPASTKSPEKESTQSRGLSLSKVPHVRGIRTSADRERERPKYTIEGLTRLEPMASRSSTGQDQARKNIDEAGRPSVSSLRSLWDK